jgi:hypothetical protein
VFIYTASFPGALLVLKKALNLLLPRGTYVAGCTAPVAWGKDTSLREYQLTLHYLDFKSVFLPGALPSAVLLTLGMTFTKMIPPIK